MNLHEVASRFERVKGNRMRNESHRITWNLAIAVEKTVDKEVIAFTIEVEERLAYLNEEEMQKLYNVLKKWKRAGLF